MRKRERRQRKKEKGSRERREGDREGRKRGEQENKGRIKIKIIGTQRMTTKTTDMINRRGKTMTRGRGA